MAKRRALNKTVQITVKLDGALTEFLDAIPNRSEFIRKAVIRYGGFACPLCGGKGYVSHEVGCGFADSIGVAEIDPIANTAPGSG